MAAYRKHFERGEAEHPLTPHKLSLLLLIAENTLLIAPQLARLSGMSEKAVRNHLFDLFHLGLVNRVGVPRASLADINAPNDPQLLYGRAPTIYTLSRDGAKLLVDQRLLTREDIADIPDYGPRNALFLAHEIQVRDVRVWLEEQRRAYPEHGGVVAWRDGSRATIELNRAYYPTQCRPDAWFVYRLHEATLAGFVEVDRGTERSPERWRDKFDIYEHLLYGERVRELTGQKRGRIVVITPNARRRDVIASILDEMLPASSMESQRFWIAERSVLDTLDWTEPLWRVPELEALQPFVSSPYL